MENIFANVELGPPIEVFQLTANFNKDPHPDKVNLGVGGECLINSKWIAFKRICVSQLD